MEPQICKLGNVIRGTWLHFTNSNHKISALEAVLHFKLEIIIIIIIMMTMTTAGIDRILATHIVSGIVLYTYELI